MVGSPDWKVLCRGKNVEIDGDGVVVSFSSGRKHKLEIRETAESFELEGVVVRPGPLTELDNAPLRAWRRNRGTQLVGFRIDRKGRLVGGAWVPKAGLTAVEFQRYLHRVAAECDHFEFLLTGADYN